MAYTLNKTNGITLATIDDGLSNTTASPLFLVGRNYSGYGEMLQENLIHIVENFANSTAPATPLLGQLWFDSSNNLLKVYTSAGFVSVQTTTASITEPSSAQTGDSWWDTGNDQLKIYNGTDWITVGPAYTKSQGVTGSISERINDSLGSPHDIVSFYIADSIIAILSTDAEFTPQVAISGFGTVKPGMNLISTGIVANAEFTGTAANAVTLNGVSSSTFARRDQSNTFTGSISIEDNSGLTLGATNQLSINYASSAVNFTNHVSGSSTDFNANVSGVITTLLELDALNGKVLLKSDPTAALGAVTKQYVDTATVDTLAAIDANVTVINGDIATVAGDLSALTSTVSGLSTSKANLASPTFTGTVRAPTPTAGDSSTNVATTAFVSGELTTALASYSDSSATGGLIAAALAPYETTANVSSKLSAYTNTVSLAANYYPKTGGTLSGALNATGAVTSGSSISAAGDINCGGAITASGDITAFSDERLKSNVTPIENALELVKQLNGVTYDKDGKRSLGLIAQNVKAVVPEVVLDGEYLSVAYGNLVGLLVEAIKEQQRQIDELKAKL